MEFKRALIVKAPYAGKIVSGEKIMEMRSMHTNIRGRVGIIEKGSGTITGSVEIIDSVSYKHDPEPLKTEILQALHCIEDSELENLDKWCYGWHLLNAIRYKKPIPYNHPQGAVTWVNFDL